MKKKGFTLIELLAVIVILAILALIAIPIVISIINDSRENSHKNSIKAYGRNVENAITSYIEKNDVNEIPKTISSYQVKMSGSKVKCDDEFEYNDEELILTHCRVVDNKGKQKSKHTYTYKNRELINEDEEGNQSFSIGQEVTVKGEKYNVIGQGSDYVTLLKQQLLTANDLNTYGSGHVNIYNGDPSDGYYHQAYDWNGYGYMSYYTSVDCGYGSDSNYTESGCTTSYEQSDVKYVVDAWAADKFNDELKVVDGYSARLVEKEELRTIGYPSCNSVVDHCSKESTTPSWLYNSNYHYWTMTQYQGSSSVVWCVDGNGFLSGNDAIFSTLSGIRPVINVYKSKI